MEYENMENSETTTTSKKSFFKKYGRWLGCVGVGLVGLFVSIIVLAIALSLSHIANNDKTLSHECASTCAYELVETIPDQLDPGVPRFKETGAAITELIDSAKDTIHIAQMYFTMSNSVGDQGHWGNAIVESLREAKKRGVKTTLILDGNGSFDDSDPKKLAEDGVLTLHKLNFGKVFGGILHTKLVIVDEKSYYVGSANFGWDSFSQVKELGVYVKTCDCAAKDIDNIWKRYYYIATSELLNESWETFSGYPHKLNAFVNSADPLTLRFNASPGNLFHSAAPPQIAGQGRTSDIKALLSVIDSAEKFVYISVMDYLPFSVYGKNHTYWGEIDTAIRGAVLRGVDVKMLISQWNQTKPITTNVLNSLVTYGETLCQNTEYHKRYWCHGELTIKRYVVPDPKGYKPFPFTRVNHAKYMVNEKTAYVSTSNWSKDYFYDTAGISFVSTHAQFRSSVEAIFERDWQSEFAHKQVV